MKEYRLTGWPDLDSSVNSTRYRRVLHAMSQRYTSVAQLASASGLNRSSVRDFMSTLSDSGLVDIRSIGLREQALSSGSALVHRVQSATSAIFRSLY